MSTCLACLSSHVPMCLACLCTHVPTCFVCSLTHVQRALRVYVLTFQSVFRACVPMCQRTLCALALTCQLALHANELTCQCVLLAYVLTCQRALSALVPTKLLRASRPRVPCMLMYSSVNVARELMCSCANMPWVSCLTRLAWQRDHLSTSFVSSVSGFNAPFFSFCSNCAHCW